MNESSPSLRLLRQSCVALLCTAAIALSPGAANAEFSAAELKCRSTIAKNGSKLVGAVGKAAVACHKNRNSDGVLPAANCNTINPTSDPKGKVSKTADKLRAAVGGEKDACASLVPADLGYFFCPANCTAEVGTISSFSDVAECIVCLAETEMSLLTQSTLGSPSPLGKTPEGKCHAAIAKNHTKLVGAVLKNRTKCQNFVEKKEGGMDTITCSGPSTKIDDASTKTDAKIQAACSPANLPSLDSCDAASATTLAACVTSAANTTGDTLFQRLYALGDAGGTTTTSSTSTSTSTSTTSTSTTTTLTAMAWTEIQSLFSMRCASCHTVLSQGGLTGLDDCQEGYDNTVNVATPRSPLDLIEPGDSNASYLMHKLDGTQGGPPANGFGGQMPQGGPFLDQTTRDRIRAWINEGAVNDCP